MLQRWLWFSALFLIFSETFSNPDLQSQIGMRIDGYNDYQESRPKRRPAEDEEDRQMVTIDLSALRPSLPGLILYKYGDHAPKLVQVDLSALNPQLQPHVIWPQFDQIELFDDRPFEFDGEDAIPYLTEDVALMPPKPRLAKITSELGWSTMGDSNDGDMYDFIPESSQNNGLMSLHGSLPLADEVIVPLDWEEGSTIKSEKRNAFTSKGWKVGGHRNYGKGKINMDASQNTLKGAAKSNVHFTPFGTVNWLPGKRKSHEGRETESEDNGEETSHQGTPTSKPGKKNVFISSGWGPGGRQVVISGHQRQGGQRAGEAKTEEQPVRVSSQESWSLPRQYWTVPHLIGSNWH